MAEVINTNVFDETKKFVDLTGLDYFWEKAKAYVDGVDSGLTTRIAANEIAIQEIKDELDSLSGGAAGSIDTQITNKIAALDVEDAAVAGQYVSAVSETDGKITVTRANLPDYSDVYDAKGSADSALTDAKAYADGLNSAMDSRVAANESALATLNGDATVDGSVDAKVTAAINDFAAKVSDDGTVNTYKELIDYAASHGAEFTELVGEVAKKANAADVYTKTEVDTAVAGSLSDAKAYADGLNSTLSTTVEDNAKTASEGISDLNSRVETLEAIDHSLYAKVADVYTKTDADAAIATAKQAAIDAAIADADAKLASYYTKTEVDDLLATNSAADQAYAKAYTDQLFDSFQFAANSDIDALFE